MNINLNALKYCIVWLAGFFPIARAVAQAYTPVSESATLPLASLALLSSPDWDKNLSGVHAPLTRIPKVDKGASCKKQTGVPLDTAEAVIETIVSPDLLQFSAVASNNNAMLQWKISDLLYARALCVEESTDGTTFTNISDIKIDTAEKINGLVITQQKERCFYRLRILNTQGQVYHTQPIACNIDIYASGNVSVTPDVIADDWLSFININTPYRGRVKIVVSNALGQQLLEFRKEIISEQSRIPIGVAAIPKGTYYIFIAKNDGSHIGTALALQKN